jgi:hypothetical protein
MSSRRSRSTNQRANHNEKRSKSVRISQSNKSTKQSRGQSTQRSRTKTKELIDPPKKNENKSKSTRRSQTRDTNIRRTKTKEPIDPPKKNENKSKSTRRSQTRDTNIRRSKTAQSSRSSKSKNDESFEEHLSQDNHEPKELRIEGRKIRLKRFDVSMIMKIAPNPAVAMIAKRGSGKSFAIRSIMNSYRDIPGGIIISKTEKMSPFFSAFFPDIFIYYQYTTETLNNLLHRQELIKGKNEIKQRKGRRVDTRAWLIMDDCLACKGTWLKDEPIQEVFMNGRHYDLFFILTMQYPLGIGPDLRTNFDFVFIFGENFINIQKKIYEHYAGMFQSFDSFRKVFRTCTVNFGCMVINNRTKSDNVEDMVYWWRAPSTDIKKFIGHKSFVTYHYSHYDNNFKYKSKRETGINDLCGRKKNYCDFKVDLVN